MDRVTPGYPGSAPCLKRPAPNTCYQEGDRADIAGPPSNTRYRVDEAASNRSRSPSPIPEVSHGRGDDSPVHSPLRRGLDDPRDDDIVSRHADSQLEGEANVNVSKENDMPPTLVLSTQVLQNELMNILQQIAQLHQYILPCLKLCIPSFTRNYRKRG